MLVNLLNFFSKKILMVLLVVLMTNVGISQTPTPTPTPTTQSDSEDEPIKINNSLIQTSVMVFDKKGNQVKNLTKDDFELFVDGKPINMSFFEKVTESEKVSSIVDKNKNTVEGTTINNSQSKIKRTIAIVIDDINTSFEGCGLTKKSAKEFIDKEITEDDYVAVISTTGKAGFFQQFTNNKEVLQTALTKIMCPQNTNVKDFQSPEMSDYDAVLIERKDSAVIRAFVEALMRERPGTTRESAETEIEARARGILEFVNQRTKRTLSALKSTVEFLKDLPSRKMMMLFSEGFLTNAGQSHSDYLKDIVNLSTRSNLAIYSFDAKGLAAFSRDSKVYSSNPGLELRLMSDRNFSVGDGLNYLAEETGGEFITNRNFIISDLVKASNEAFTYYILAWETEEEVKPSDNVFRKIKAIVKNYPEYKVRMNRGFLADNKDSVKEKSVKNSSVVSNQSVEITELKKTLYKQTEDKSLPVNITLNYIDIPSQGALLQTGLQIKKSNLDFIKKDNIQESVLDVLGYIYNEEGKVQESISKRFTVTSALNGTSQNEKSEILYNFQTNLKPGWHQIRFAVRDSNSQKTGSVIQWIKIPDLSSKKLALSSLLIGNAPLVNNSTSLVSQNSPLPVVNLSTSKEFSRLGILRAIVFIYNSKVDKETQLPNITGKIEILKDGNLIVSSKEKEILIDRENINNPVYGVEIPLGGLAPGKYKLKATITDKVDKKSEIQETVFEVIT